MFNVSTIILPARIETTTDAYRILETEADREAFIIIHGNVNTEYDSAFDVHRVPAFARDNARFVAAKRRACERHGCE